MADEARRAEIAAKVAAAKRKQTQDEQQKKLQEKQRLEAALLSEPEPKVIQYSFEDPSMNHTRAAMHFEEHGPAGWARWLGRLPALAPD